MPRKGIKKEYVTVSIPIELAKQRKREKRGKNSFFNEEGIRDNQKGKV